MQPLNYRSTHVAKVVQLSVIKTATRPTSIYSPTRIAITLSDGIRFVALKDIIRLEADGNYTHIYLIDNAHHLISKTIGSLDQVLPQDQFIRCHQSHLVNNTHIKQIKNFDEIIMTDDQIVSISRANKKRIKEWVAQMKLY